MSQRPYLLEFIRDFGDAIGGMIAGYGFALNLLGHIIAGGAVILLTIFLRFYRK